MVHGLYGFVFARPPRADPKDYIGVIEEGSRVVDQSRSGRPRHPDEGRKPAGNSLAGSCIAGPSAKVKDQSWPARLGLDVAEIRLFSRRVLAAPSRPLARFRLDFSIRETAYARSPKTSLKPLRTFSRQNLPPCPIWRYFLYRASSNCLVGISANARSAAST